MSEKPTSDALLKIIRDHCLECSGGSRWDVHNCLVRNCKLWPYRKGEPLKKKERKNKKNRQITVFDLMEDLENGDR